MLATKRNLLCSSPEQNLAPSTSVVLGMTTIPAVAPDDPIVQIAKPVDEHVRKIDSRIVRQNDKSLGLASNKF